MAKPKTPLRQWRVRFFKSIEKADVDFLPLTVLVGPNSSGKSSLLQSILVMVQAAQMRPRGDTFPLNGPLVELGEYPEVHSAFANSRQELSIGGTLDAVPAFRSFSRKEAELRELRAIPGDLTQAAKWELRLAGRDKAQPGSTHVSRIKLEVAGGRSLVDEDTSLILDAKRRASNEDDLEKLFRGRWLRPGQVGDLPAIAFMTGEQKSGRYSGRSAARP